MTLIITAIAALITAIVYLRDPAAARSKQLGVLVLTYLGAALMWCVDGFACLAEGEPFVELADTSAMADDALLGVCVVALGLVAWLVVRLVVSKKALATAAA